MQRKTNRSIIKTKKQGRRSKLYDGYVAASMHTVYKLQNFT